MLCDVQIQMQREFADLKQTLEMEKEFCDRLEEQLNDLTELHQHEMANIKQVFNTVDLMKVNKRSQQVFDAVDRMTIKDIKQIFNTADLMKTY